LIFAAGRGAAGVKRIVTREHAVHPVEDNGMDGAIPPIEFVTDGRTYEPTGRRSGEFVIVFGTLVRGPSAPPFGASWVVEFSAELTRPDGARVLVDAAHVDYPVAGESPEEGPFVLLRGVRAADVPLGTSIVSLSG
jgi:hypothetical protein